jgi:hypothetical protein
MAAEQAASAVSMASTRIGALTGIGMAGIGMGRDLQPTSPGMSAAMLSDD